MGVHSGYEGGIFMRLAAAMLAVLWSGIAMAQDAVADIDAYGEEFAPYSFMRDGKPAGISTDLLKRACTEAGLRCKIRITPWMRAYHTAMIQKNALVFSTSRTPERESRFQWVGPILPRAVSLYVLTATNFSPERLAGRDGFIIGTVYNDVSVDALRRLGVPDSAMENSPTLDDAQRKLMAGRISAVINTDVGMKWFLHSHGYDFSAVKAVMPMPETGAYYYALNPEMDPAIAGKLQAGLETAMRNNALTEILDSYLAGRPSLFAPGR